MKKLILASLLVGSCALGSAQTVMINPDKDNTMYGPIGNRSNGAGDHLFAGQDNNSRNKRALLHFDVAAFVPAGATINAVSLTMNMSKTIAGPENVSIHTVTQDWGEGSDHAAGQEGQGFFPSSAGSATWDEPFEGGAPWTSAGGDFTGTASATASVNAIGFYNWSSAQMVTDVQNWLDTPGNNFGWVVIGNESTNATAKRFDSKDNSNPNVWPVLTITYSGGASNPPVITTEPTDTAMCVGIGASFTVAGTDITGYQWQEDQGSGFANVTNGGIYSGATTGTLTITVPTIGMDTWTYRCITTGAAAPNDTSNVALLTVNPLPPVTITPGTGTVCVGDSLTLTGSNPGGGSVQWYMNGTPLAGETNQTLIVTAAGTYNQYKTNSNGCSDSAANGSIITISNPPIVSLLPGDTMICSGDSIQLQGTAGVSQQWYMNGSAIPGATGNSYFASTSGTYNMEMTDGNNCTDSAAVGLVVTVDTCTGIFENQFDVLIYPNPAHGKLFIGITGVNENLNMSLLNPAGQLIRSRQLGAGVEQAEIDISGIATGVYFLRLEGRTGVGTYEVVIQ